MKKLLTVFILCFVFAFCAIGVAACDCSSKNTGETENNLPADNGDNNENTEDEDEQPTDEKYFSFTLMEGGTYEIIVKEEYLSEGELSAELPEKIVIPSEYNGVAITSIGNEAFRDCSDLTSVTIGNSVTSIGDSAFYNCSKLKSITIPDSVTSIGIYAFSSCSSLTSVTIGNSVTSIGDYAFYYSGLTSVIIGSSVTSIGKSAFNRCSSLSEITIPDSVTSIGGAAFSACTGLTSVTIGNGIKSIGNSAFYGCSSLNDITFNGTKEQWQAISTSPAWNKNVPATVVHCSDGDLDI